MNSIFKNIVCRICLDDNVAFDWNNTLIEYSDITYKDCYYKYTQLKQLDNDPLSSMLCKSCLNGLEGVHSLIMKALDSYNFLTGDNETFASTDFEAALLENPATLQQFEHHRFDESSIKFPDEFHIFEGIDEMQYQKMHKREEQEECMQDVKEDSPKICETATKSKKISCKRKFKNDADPNKINLNNSRIACSRHKSVKMEKKCESFEENSAKSNDEKMHILEEHEECDENYGTGNRLTNENIHNLRLQTECNDSRTKNICEPKRNTTKTKGIPIMCSYCSKILNSKYAVVLHEKTHMDNRERNETCKVCGLKFYDKKALYAHKRVHKENREKIHKCEFCSKAFYDKGGLNIHRRIHLGQMISCTLCSKKFYRKIDLDRHMGSHSATPINSDTKKRSRYFVRCKHCGKSILSTSFKSHTAAHLNEPLMKCSICSKEFFRRASCVIHIKKIHQKTNEEYNDFITLYTKNRISHLFLEQKAEIQFSSE